MSETDSKSGGSATSLSLPERMEMLGTMVGVPLSGDFESPGIRLGNYLGQFIKLAQQYGSGSYTNPRTQGDLSPREYLACLSCLSQKIHLTAGILLKEG